MINPVNLIATPLNRSLAKLEPRLRVVIVYLLASVVLIPLATILYGSLVLGGIWGGMLALFVIYIAFRSGYFAETVMLQLPGDERPSPEKIRSTQGGLRFATWDDVEYVSAEDGDEELSGDDRVVGLEINGEAVAYPLSAMSLREAANEETQDRPITVTWSPIAYSARAFVAQGPSGEPIAFAPLPKTILNTSLFEAENGSLYMQFTGEAIKGPDAGHSLEHIPCVNTTWQAWKSAWPETDVMSSSDTPESDIFETYYASSRPGLHTQPSRDRRLPDKDVVLGVFVPGRDGGRRCFSAHGLRETPLRNDRLGSTSVLVVCERSSATYVAFDRRVEGKDLTFEGLNKNPYRPNRVVERDADADAEEERVPDAAYEPWLLKDDQTGSLWHSISGACIEGPHAGSRLKMLDGRLAFWYAWSKLHSDIELVV